MIVDGQARGPTMLGDPKVCDSNDVGFVFNQNIVWFQIAMNNSGSVGRSQA